MKRFIYYLLPVVIIILFQACSLKEIYEPVTDSEFSGNVTFKATPSKFTHNPETKGAGTGNFSEDAIHNAYFLLFDNSGNMLVKEEATITSQSVEATTTYNITYSVGEEVFNNSSQNLSAAKVCFIANVSPSDVADIATWQQLQSTDLTIEYATSAVAGTIGVPLIDVEGNGTKVPCIPMFSSETVNLSPSGRATASRSINLERLFARVEMWISLGIADDGSILTSKPQFQMIDCVIKNIPKRVPVVGGSTTTSCYSLSTAEANTWLLGGGDDEDSEKKSPKELDKRLISNYNLSNDLNSLMLYSNPATYKKLYFYVPEHKLGNCGNNSVPANKPTLISENKRAIHATISGILVDGEGVSYNVKYNIYLGGNATDDFDINRNTRYVNTVRIIGVNNHSESSGDGVIVDHRVEISKIESNINPVDKKGQTANCYIIGSAGMYYLPAYRGAYASIANAEMCDFGRNEVIACDNPNIIITIDEDLSKQSTIVFKVETKNAIDLFSGNAVIARYVNATDDEGNPIYENGKIKEVIDWSWHLWFIPGINFENTDLSAIGRIGGLQDEKMPDGTTMANRNVGVTGSITNAAGWIQGTQLGFYYKYGYHAPYFEDKVYNKGKAYHGLNDTNFSSWEGNTKSKTDPCPPGYRIPPASVWEGTNESAASPEYYNDNAIRYWDRGDNALLEGADLLGLNDIYYPYSGYLDTNLSVQYERGIDAEATQLKADDYRTFTIDNIRTDEVVIKTEEKETDLGVTKLKTVTETFSYTEYKYTDFVYETKLKTLNTAYLWTSGNKFLRCAHQSNEWIDYEICSCSFSTRELTRERRTYYYRRRVGGTLFNPIYVWEIANDIPIEDRDFIPGDWSQPSTITNESNDVIISSTKVNDKYEITEGSINNNDWRNSLKSNQSNRVIMPILTVPFTPPSQKGYQVRCLKESTQAN